LIPHDSFIENRANTVTTLPSSSWTLDHVKAFREKNIVLLLRHKNGERITHKIAQRTVDNYNLPDSPAMMTMPMLLTLAPILLRRKEAA
jgi:hypothetical protein